MESLRTRAKARRDEIYRFIAHTPAAIKMSMKLRRKKEFKIVSICDQTGLVMFIMMKRLNLPFKWLSIDIENVFVSGSCRSMLAGL